MQTVGIICEYNPFHSGHAHQIAAARRDTGAQTVIAVMSEHVSERGELAVADGYVRAKAAVRCGADLVIGLPFPYSAAPAEFFALAGVRILNALGTEALHFGSECGDLDQLRLFSDRLCSRDFIDRLTAYQASHADMGILACRDALYREQYGHVPSVSSNDLLAINYLHALQSEHSAMRPYTVKREGQSYNDSTIPMQNAHPSASALRALWQKRGFEALRAHLPAPVFEVLQDAQYQQLAPLNAHAIGTAVLTHFRLTSPTVLSTCSGLDGGLAERLCAAAHETTDLASLLHAAATRRYTDARLRRSLWYGICGITDSDLSAPPAYARLLAANERGCAHLAAIRKHCPLPIITKPADTPMDAASVRQRTIDERLFALLSLALPNQQSVAYWLRRRPYIEQAGKK